MASPAILNGAEDQTPKMPATFIQRLKLDRIQVGVIAQQSPILHAHTILPKSADMKLALVRQSWESGIRVVSSAAFGDRPDLAETAAAGRP